MASWNASYEMGKSYEINFCSVKYEEAKAVEKVCCAIMDKEVTCPNDIEVVRHGKWIVTAGGKQCTCSVCGEEFDNTCNYDIRKDWKCCPVCRCLMDGE